MHVITDSKKPIKIWMDISQVDENALKQLKNTANLPFIFKHVAVMADVHYGKGATVGSVIATKGAVCPAAVGADIGCGMMAVKTTLDHKIVKEKSRAIRRSIEEVIPLGVGGINHKQPDHINQWTGWHELEKLNETKVIDKELKKNALMQLGSLGAGNHFIEICLDTENNVWAMLHSGSRGIGNKVSARYIAEAKKLMSKMFIELTDLNLAYLVQDTDQYNMYLSALKWCQDYAYKNRQEMMNRVLKQLSIHCNNKEPVRCEMEINCHHNYAEMEHHYQQDVLITRKGAVRARIGDYGIIPGSMGTKSYIVEGLGELQSFNSCSHGAGRRMSRNQAIKTFSASDLERETKGVECRKDQEIVDEIPSAYKNIDEVMANQKDLVKVLYILKQIICVKG